VFTQYGGVSGFDLGICAKGACQAESTCKNDSKNLSADNDLALAA